MSAIEKGREVTARLQPYSAVMAANRIPDEKKVPITSIMVTKPIATTIQP
jgi:hypothetical protein